MKLHFIKVAIFVFTILFILINLPHIRAKYFESKNHKIESIEVKRINESLVFCRKNKLDTNIAFLIDMKIHSGKKRFFVVDLQKKKVVLKSLCCHGMGGNSSEEKVNYSNVVGSNCTSLGKYKTGLRSYSQWGIHIHYKMHGLEKTNNNAFKRTIVLHSYDPISEIDIYPSHLPMGWSLGCPVISNITMTKVDSILKDKKRDVLIWIYN